MIVADKKEGETLSELIARARREHELSADVSITYAGRLDPMASGVVILLVGDEVHEKEVYLGLDKEYSFDVLFGISTDTLDALGIATLPTPLNAPLVTEETIRTVAQSFVGEYEQTYPAYSSKPINGEPSFVHARAGSVVEQPKHTVALREIQLVSVRTERIVSIAREAVERVGCVSGDFRQEPIVDSWRMLALQHAAQEVVVASMTARVGSGFYIRSFAADLAQKLGTVGIAWRIRRERIIMRV
jgi:tRNA pseudouridine55 synthase